MSKETDSLENFIIEGNLSVKPGINIDSGPGNIECVGTVFVDVINENTVDTGVTIENTLFKDSAVTFTDSTLPATPVSSKNVFYTDSLDSFFKSVNSSGNLKIYNPSTTKGDIITHDGVTDVRLPVGTSNQVLTVNLTQSSGLQWVTPSSSIPFLKIFNLAAAGIADSAFVITCATGSFFACIAPLNLLGASCIFLASKSTPSTVGSNVRICNNQSLTNSGNLILVWNAYKHIQIYKSFTEGDSGYSIADNNDYTILSSVTLTGTTWVPIITTTSGAYFITINSEDTGPCMTFVICKSDSTLNSGAVNILTSSPSSSGTTLNVRWLSNSNLEIQKSSVPNNNGNYQVIDNFQKSKTTIINLSGTSLSNVPKIFFDSYEKKSLILGIYSSIVDSPKSIVFISKNINTNSGSQLSVRSPGKTTLELLNLSWSSNNLLRINKDNVNYDGNYFVDIILPH